ncbi:MAG: enoyl-CoA hydratase/isomerase family protein, partial [Bacteroidota bacterium]
MQIYPADIITPPDQQTFAYLEVEVLDHVLHVTLDREQKRNAIHPQMVNELAFCMQYAHQSPQVWMILIKAKGPVFCAGADLKAFAGMVEPD